MLFRSRNAPNDPEIDVIFGRVRQILYGQRDMILFFGYEAVSHGRDFGEYIRIEKTLSLLIRSITPLGIEQVRLAAGCDLLSSADRNTDNLPFRE